MNDLLKDLIDTGKVEVYIDDILIYTMDKEEHRKLVNEVLWRLQENDLFVKPEKCKLMVEEVEFLGCILGKEGSSGYHFFTTS
jgi:hypothetical protein